MQTSLVASVAIPDLSSFTFHKVLYDVEFGGVAVPGLVGAYYRRPCGDAIESVGIYMVGGAELFRAWGFVEQEHCSHHAVAVSGGVAGPYVGCPDIEVRRDGDLAEELIVRAGDVVYRHVVGSATTWESVGGGVRRDRLPGLALGEPADVPQ